MKIHLDLDSFFVSAHRIYDKSLLNKPVVVVKKHDKEIFELKKAKVLNLNKGAFTGDIIVCANKSDGLEKKVRGIVVTASYEARVLGIKTGTTLKEALEIYPNLIVLEPDYKLYHLLSYKLKLFLKRKIPLVEQYSIDEFFGDLRGYVEEKEVFEFCKELKKEIYLKFSLPISIGIAKTKWIAKLATSFAKPNGIYQINSFSEIENVKIEKFPGIGKRLEKRLKQRGIYTLFDIKNNKEYFYSWGKHGIKLYNRVCGIDNDEVKEKNIKKSIGISRRFDGEANRYEILRRINILCRYISFLVLKYKLNPTLYYLKIKYKNKTSSKAYMKVCRIFNELLLKDVMKRLFFRADLYEFEPIISINIVLAKFKRVTNLFDFEKDKKIEKLNSAIFKIRQKYGVNSILGANEINGNI